MVAVRHRAR